MSTAEDDATRNIVVGLFDKDVYVSEYDILMAIEAIKVLPPSAVAILQQRDVKFYPVNTGVALDDISPGYSQHLDAKYSDPRDRAEALDKVNAAYVPAERRVYIVEPDPGTIVHEIGHVVDNAIATNGIWSSYSDHLLSGIYEREALNDYSRENIIEAWAEWFRASHDIPNPESLDPNADDKDRRAMARNAPTALAYVDAIERAIELELVAHPRAFAEGRDMSGPVVLRAQLAIAMGEAVAEITAEDIEFATTALKNAVSVRATHPEPPVAEVGKDELSLGRIAMSALTARGIPPQKISEVPVPSRAVVGEILAIDERHVAVAVTASAFALYDREEFESDIAVSERVEIRNAAGSLRISRVRIQISQSSEIGLVQISR